MDGPGLGKLLIAIGLLVLVVGLALVAGVRFPFGQLPGDISARRGNVSFSFPLASCLLLSLLGSVALTVVLNLINRK